MPEARDAGVEFVLTFALILVTGGAEITGGFGLDATGIALAAGFAAAAAIASGERPAGQANPAITVALWVTGRLSSVRAGVVIGAQLLGAVTAGVLLRYVNPGTAYVAASGGTPAVASGTAAGKAIVIEASATFILVFVYFATVVGARAGRTRTGAIITGLAIVGLVMVFSPFTGAAMNPARWFGPALASGTWADWEVWLIGPIAGGIIAAVASTALRPPDDDLETT